MENRRKEFARNHSLELLLKEVNRDLWLAEKKLVRNCDSDFPLIFIMGPLRSGSTLFLQWLASTGVFSYPTNLLSRFYQAPIIGAKIQLLLADERYNYRDELMEFKSTIDFCSENGKTKGALAPNEFWYFWRRFLPFDELDYLPSDELLQRVDMATMKAEFVGMMQVFAKPMVLKGMILNYNIDFLDQLFNRAVFIHIKRDPLANIESALKARERQFGSIEKWYSFKIPEYESLIKCDPFEQVAGQIYYINRAVEKGLEKVSVHKKMTVQYEDFCENPRLAFEELQVKLHENGFNINHEYRFQEKFNVSKRFVDDPRILKAYKKYR